MIIKKINIIKLLFIVFLLLLPCFVFAGDNAALGTLKTVGKEGGYTEADQFTMSEMAGSIIQSLLSLLGVVFVALMLYGGFKWMKASGREEDVKSAQAIIRQAIIGLIITTSAWTISRFVLAALTN